MIPAWPGVENSQVRVLIICRKRMVCNSHGWLWLAETKRHKGWPLPLARPAMPHGPSGQDSFEINLECVMTEWIADV